MEDSRIQNTGENRDQQKSFVDWWSQSGLPAFSGFSAPTDGYAAIVVVLLLIFVGIPVVVWGTKEIEREVEKRGKGKQNKRKSRRKLVV